MEIHLGMKRERIERLRDELTKALDEASDGRDVEVVLYGDVDKYGVKVTISNDDMEHLEVPAEAVYATVERF